MGGELGLNGTQQPDLGGDLGGQVGEGDGWVAVVEGERCLCCGDPLGGPLGTVVTVGGLGDERAESLDTQLDQDVGVGPAFQHGEVADPEIPRQRAHR